MKYACTLFLLAFTSLFAGCKTPPPEGATTLVNFKADADDSPYWESIMDRYIIEQVNRHARYKLVSQDSSLTYTLNVILDKSSSKVAGIKHYTYSSVPQYHTIVEGTAKLYDHNDEIIWSWSGWAQDMSETHAIEELGAAIGRAMKSEGLLNPTFYK